MLVTRSGLRAILHLFGLIIILIVVSYVAARQHFASDVCNAFYRKDSFVDTGSKQINVELARDPTKQAIGLAGRPCIGQNQGMLFIFPKEASYPIWMENMRFSIDVIWINAKHKVVNMKRNLTPDTYPRTFTNDQPAMYVLEIGAGQADKLGVSVGSTLIF